MADGNSSGVNGSPSHRYRLSKVQRCVPVCGSVPIIASIIKISVCPVDEW